MGPNGTDRQTGRQLDRQAGSTISQYAAPIDMTLYSLCNFSLLISNRAVEVRFTKPKFLGL